LVQGKQPDALDSAGSAAHEGSSNPHPGAVFVSYASQDAEAASRICHTMREAGIEVWFDQSELRGGDSWDQSIRKQIKTCALFLPVISRNTHDRDEGYFRLEWKLAVDRCHLMSSDKAFLVPVVIDDTRDDDERVPERFREVQWTRLPNGVTPPAFAERVRRLLIGELSKGPTRTASEAARVSAAPTQQHVRAFWRPKAALLLAIAVVVAALGYLVANRLAQSEHVARPGLTPESPIPAAPATVFNPPPHSIAVLPFVNMSGDAKQDYFSDGISEELLNALSRLNDLQVMARTSSFSFKGQNVDISTIAHKLNVGAVLEGSVRRAGNTVRVTVQLINAVSGFHIWSQTYDRNLTDILKVQTEVAMSVAQELKLRLSEDSSLQLELGSTSNSEAYDAYLHGVQLRSQAATEQSGALARLSLAEFDRAASLDSQYAQAYARRADGFVQVSEWEHDQAARHNDLANALESAERAIALAPEFGEAHLSLGKVRLALLDPANAAPEFDRALVLAPGSAPVQSGFASFAALLGHFDVAVKAARQGVSLDPQNVSAHLLLVDVLINARRFDEALVALRNASVLDPTSRWVAGTKANLFLASGHVEDAVRHCESSNTRLDQWARSNCLALAYHASGRPAEAERELQRFKSIDGDTSAYFYAGTYAQWGDKSAALQWLTKAEQLRDPGLPGLKVDWELDPIRNEPQFKAILTRMKFPP
jgi:TolB-like protein/predicted Zn-dependent protease